MKRYVVQWQSSLTGRWIDHGKAIRDRTWAIEVCNRLKSKSPQLPVRVIEAGVLPVRIIHIP